MEHVARLLAVAVDGDRLPSSIRLAKMATTRPSSA